MVALFFVIKPTRPGAEALLLAQVSISSRTPADHFNLKVFPTY